MMEEVNDDATGESTFEFVGGKADDSVANAGLVQSSAKSVEDANNVLPSATSAPTTASASNLFTTAPGPIWGIAPPQASTSVRPPESSPFSPSIPAGVASVPMMNPNLTATPMTFPGTVAAPPHMYPPAREPSPYIPPGQGYLGQSPAPIPTTYGSQASVPQAAYELPIVDESYNVLNSPQSESSGDHGVWGWIKGNEFLNKVAEKAKSSVDSVITTLDPGMKEIIYSGGNINVVVASGNETKVSAIREAFQQTFGKATIDSIAVQTISIAPQPVGFSAATKAAEERIGNLRQQGIVSEDQVIVAVENFLAELTPDKWFDIGCLMLQDPSNNINLQVYTQAIPVETHYVMQAKQQTPPDYLLGWSGFAITIGQVLGSALGVHHSQWHQALTGTSRRDMLLLAAKSLAGLYKARRNSS